MKKFAFSVVGCGSLGSNVAYALTLKSLGTDIQYLCLIDNDILEEKNLPYLLYLPYLIGKSKVESLKKILKMVNPNLPIYAIFASYPLKDELLENSYRIDCRDSKEIDPYFNLRLRVDGNFGIVQTNPKSLLDNEKTNYKMGVSPFDMIQFSTYCTGLIFEKFLNNLEEEFSYYEKINEFRLKEYKVSTIPRKPDYIMSNGHTISGIDNARKFIKNYPEYKQKIYFPRGEILEIELDKALRIYEEEKIEGLDCICLSELDPKLREIRVILFPIPESA